MVSRITPTVVIETRVTPTVVRELPVHQPDPRKQARANAARDINNLGGMHRVSANPPSMRPSYAPAREDVQPLPANNSSSWRNVFSARSNPAPATTYIYTPPRNIHTYTTLPTHSTNVHHVHHSRASHVSHRVSKAVFSFFAAAFLCGCVALAFLAALI